MATPSQGENVNGVSLFNETAGQIESVDVSMFEHGGGLYPGRASLLRALGIDFFDAAQGARVPGLTFPCGLDVVPALSRVLVNKAEIPRHLTIKEFTLLTQLAVNGEAVIDRDELLARAWGVASPYCGDTHVVDVHMSNIKRKLAAQEGHGHNPGPNAGLIANVRGKGFRMGGRAYSVTPLVFPR